MSLGRNGVTKPRARAVSLPKMTTTTTAMLHMGDPDP